MNQTGTTDSNLPLETREPTEFAGGWPDRFATDGRFKAADFKYDTVRVGKCMDVLPINHQFFGTAGDHMPALAAQQKVVFVG